MIVPIVKSVSGEDETIGAAAVVSDDCDDVSVEYYLKPEFSMAEAVMIEMTKQLKKLARR